MPPAQGHRVLSEALGRSRVGSDLCCPLLAHKRTQLPSTEERTPRGYPRSVRGSLAQSSLLGCCWGSRRKRPHPTAAQWIRTLNLRAGVCTLHPGFHTPSFLTARHPLSGGLSEALGQATLRVSETEMGVTLEMTGAPGRSQKREEGLTFTLHLVPRTAQ